MRMRARVPVHPAHPCVRACACAGLCVWGGVGSALLGVGSGAAECPPLHHSLSVPDKGWLPADWRQQLSAKKDAGTHKRKYWDPEEEAAARRAGSKGVALFLWFFFLMMLSFACCSAFVTVRQRRVRQMGGAAPRGARTRACPPPTPSCAHAQRAYACTHPHVHGMRTGRVHTQARR